MPPIHLGRDSNAGGRKYNEDRAAVAQITTAGGQALAVAIVCDGVGGEERGERAAQLAVDTFLKFLRESELTETPRILSLAVKAANQAVYSEADRLDAQERMACTLVAAAIDNRQTLYIANAGDSRIYLCRGGQLTQLTRDHNFANVMVWMGKLSPEAAASNPDADKVMRVLGVRENIQVDLGLYQDTVDFGEANKLGRTGLPLQPGDSVVLCSDGLVKPTQTSGQPLISLDEIGQVLGRQEGEKAAQALMSTALGRIPVGEAVDNITVAVMQTEDPGRAVFLADFQRKQRAAQQRDLRRKVLIAVVAAAVPLGLLLLATLAVFASFFSRTNSASAATATRLAETALAAVDLTEIARIETEIAASFTPTPTLTPTPTATAIPPLEPGEIARLFVGDSDPQVVIDDKRLISAEAQPAFIAVNHLGLEGGQTETGNIYLEPATQLQFNAVNTPKFQLRLLPGSDVFVRSGPYPNGAEIELAGSPIVLVVRGCVAVIYSDANLLTADCYEGECAVSTDFGVTSTDIGRGKQLTLDIGSLEFQGSPGNIPQRDHDRYLALLRLTGAGRQDISACRVPIPPTITPTVRPTNTPQPTPKPYGG